jgi:drug/metabolite transporter (DMT)-like permease
MDLSYILGVATAIFCGVCMQAGILIQKKVVNNISVEDRAQRFLPILMGNPQWLGGLFLEYGVGTAAYMIAQNLIGPALVPGLMASGLIVLAIGSVKIIGETLNFSEYLGIALLMTGIALLGFSELDVGVDVVRDRLASSNTAFRLAILTLSLLILWILTHLQSLRFAPRKGMINAVLSGRGSWQQTGVFVLASAILVGCNILGILQTNEAFRFAQASNVIPVQQLSVQITPILFYFYVYALTPPKAISGVLIIAAVALIISAVFLLGRRQAELERIP